MQEAHQLGTTTNSQRESTTMDKEEESIKRPNLKQATATTLTRAKEAVSPQC